MPTRSRPGSNDEKLCHKAIWSSIRRVVAVTGKIQNADENFDEVLVFTRGESTRVEQLKMFFGLVKKSSVALISIGSFHSSMIIYINYKNGVTPTESACELLDERREEYFKFN